MCVSRLSLSIWTKLHNKIHQNVAHEKLYLRSLTEKKQFNNYFPFLQHGQVTRTTKLFHLGQTKHVVPIRTNSEFGPQYTIAKNAFYAATTIIESVFALFSGVKKCVASDQVVGTVFRDVWL